MADKALLVGINVYLNVNPLRGCENDVAQMRTLLMETFGFPEADIRVRVNENATKANVSQELDWLLGTLRPGDRAVFHFSGHGSYIADTTGESEDGKDELICLYDMDFGNPGSYFLDKELRRRFDPIPPSVLLVTFDSCHSGNGTRLIEGGPHLVAAAANLQAAGVHPGRSLLVAADTLRRSKNWGQVVALLGLQERAVPVMGLQAALVPPEPADLQQAVIARFVPPPENIQAEVRRRRIVAARAVGAREIPESRMTETLLAACRRDQTAADAYIGGSYHGAFTYNLCQVLKPNVTRQDLLSSLRDSLRKEGFAQEPQLEGRSHTGPLFGTTVAPGPVPAEGSRTPPTSSQTRLLGLLAEVQRLILAGPGGVQPRDAGTRYLVYVHGICKHDPGYSNGWWNAMSPYVPSVQPGILGGNRLEVLWSDVVRPSRDLVRGVADGRALSQELQDVLRDRAQRQVAEATPQLFGQQPLPTVADRELFGIPGLDCVDDFTIYLIDESIRDQVIDRFRNVVAPLLSAGAQVEVVSHSWGTVVAYEALCRMEADFGTGAVLNFFTVGSALSILPVKRRLIPEARDGHRPRMVKRWVNLNARGDIVGGVLKDHPFSVDSEFLGLEPVGCAAFLGLVQPACAHGSYFQTANLAVNRDIFGRLIES